MSFSRPELLFVALLAVPELLLCLRRLPKLRDSLTSLAGPRRRAAAARSYTAFSLVGAAAGALFIIAAALAMAMPSWGQRGRTAERRGLEAAIVLDVSRSMEARDMGGRATGAAGGANAATRLAAAKTLISGLLIDRDPLASSTAFSLVAAKGGSVLLVPMTEDRIALADGLVYADADAISSPGTDLESGLREALRSFSPSGAQARLVLLFTDGGELTGSARRACEELAAARARLVVVGLGDTKPAAVPGPDGKPLAGEKGPVTSALRERELELLAAQAGGRYLGARSASAGSALAALLAESAGVGMRVEYERVDRSGAFALAAFFFLLVAVIASMLAPRAARL
jgi:Ca-activated chloride channel family protein